MNIQRFASWDDLITDYNNQINKTVEQQNNLQTEKQAKLDEYNTNYNNQLGEYQNLLDQQQNLIDTQTQTQKDIQQKQTDYNINLINQNKQEAAKQVTAEKKDAYTDYMKQINQYGGAAETLASQGLSTQGYAESSKVGMYNTYQNRVSTAQEALIKANTDYDNQIQQALLNNDAALAELALNQMTQSYQLALQGFEYKNNMYNEKLNYTQALDDTYYGRNQDMQNYIDNYKKQIATIKQQQVSEAQWQKEFEESKKQWQKEFDEQKRQYNESLKASRGSSGSVSLTGNNDSTKAQNDYYTKLYNQFYKSLNDYSKKMNSSNGVVKAYTSSVYSAYAATAKVTIASAYEKGYITKNQAQTLFDKLGL